MRTKVKVLLFGLLCFAMLFGLIPTTAYAVTPVENVDMMITHPVHLSEPETFLQIYGGNCQIDTSVNTDGYQDGLRWRRVLTGQIMSATDTFVGGELYELSVCLVAQSGFAFVASEANVTVNMEPASLTVQDASHATATIQLLADNLYVNTVTLSGLDMPKLGKTLDDSVSVIENTCQIGGLAWVDLTDQKYVTAGTKGQAWHEYWAEINIVAKPGYEFPENIYVSVDGESATIERNDGASIVVIAKFPKLDDHVHSPSEWRTTQVYHYKVCTSCGDMLEQEDHKGGVATCAEKGVCTVCNYAYIDVHENHTPDTKWTACGTLYHAHLCIICGAHCDPEDHRWSPRYHAVDESGHAYQCADCKGYDTIIPHNPGPAATETTPQTCTDCGYVIAPVKEHVHDFSRVPKVPASCTEGGNIEYYVCVLCMDCFTDPEGKNKIPESMSVLTDPLGHTASQKWTNDENYHWRTCTVCKVVLTETKTAHEKKDGKCTTCDFRYSIPEDTTAAPIETTPDPTEAKTEESPETETPTTEKEPPETETTTTEKESPETEPSTTEEEPLETETPTTEEESPKTEASTTEEESLETESPTTPESSVETTQPQEQTPTDTDDMVGLPWWGYLLIVLGGVSIGSGVALIIAKRQK